MLNSIPVSEFKTLADVSLVQIVKNPNTSKLFAACDNDKNKNFKVQGDIDVDMPITFLVDTEPNEDGTFATPDAEQLKDGCFVNPAQNNVVTTL